MNRDYSKKKKDDVEYFVGNEVEKSDENDKEASKKAVDSGLKSFKLGK